MKSMSLREMDVVPAPFVPTPTATVAHELHEMLGDTGEAHLRHLMDGRPVHAVGLLAGPGGVAEESRSPRVRFLAGPLYFDEPTGRWYGPVLPEAHPGRATYVDPEQLAHQDCLDCAGAWLRAAGRHSGARLEEFEVVPGTGALIAVDDTAAARLRTA